MVGTNDSINDNNKFYNEIVQAISRGGRSCATKVGALCAYFLIWYPQLKPRRKWDGQNIQLPGSEH